jgi:response regulator NasT
LDNTDLLAERVEELHPDMIIIDLDSPNRDVLENMALLNDRSPRPVVMFAEQGDSDTISQAIRSGVSAYVVDGLEYGRISSILEVAAARFREFQALRRELVEARSELADRKLIEKAKGLVMKRHKCPEDDAFKAMRRMAMDQQKPLAEIARNIIAVMEII